MKKPVVFNKLSKYLFAGFRNKSYFFLTKLAIYNKMIAPTKAVINEPNKPTESMPNKPNTHPPITPPTMPTIILINKPKPPPFITRPASHPATAPIIKNQRKLMIIEIF